MNGKSYKFQSEVRLGLVLIILILVILNFASHYTLYRVRQSLEAQVQDGLMEKAVIINDILRRQSVPILPDSILLALQNSPDRESLHLFLIGYDKVIALQQGQHPASLFPNIDSSLKAEDLLPVLKDQATFIYVAQGRQCLLLFPAEHIGTRYIISLAKDCDILVSIENAGRVLVFFGILGILLIGFVARRFIRRITDPFERLREKALQSGRLIKSGDDEAVELIASYEKIIDDLKNNEKELLQLHDIAARRAEDLETFNNYIMRSINTGIMSFDRAGKLSSMNRAAGEILGLGRVGCHGEHFERLTENFPELKSRLMEYWKAPFPLTNVRVDLKPSEGQTRATTLSIADLRDSQGNAIGFSMILNDQTEFLRMQEELELNRRMASLGEMSGGLAHQLRNSTAAIAGFARLLAKKSTDDNLKETARQLLKESLETAELVGKFLDFARPLHIAESSFAVAELLDTLLATAAAKYGEGKVHRQPGLNLNMKLLGDPLLLKQALGNILDNACRAASFPAGRVEIGVTEEAGMAQISISDNGPGIPAAIADKIFTPFYSGSASGTGLGLSLARKIIAQHGGRIEFHSEPNTGTTFLIYLPTDRSATGICAAPHQAIETAP